MIYNEFPPSEKLAFYVESFYEVKGGSEIKKEVPPRLGGCLIFDFKSNTLIDGVLYKTAVLGVRFSPYNLHTTNVNDRIVVTFSPYGLSHFCKIPIHKMNNCIKNAEEIFGDDVVDLHAKLSLLETTSKRIRLIENFLLGHLTPCPAGDKWIFEVADKLSEGTSLTGIYKSTPVSIRQLQRKFKARTGLSMKTYRKIARYAAVFLQMRENNFAKLSDLALDTGYYDQSHFISDIKSLTNKAPSHQIFC